MLRQAARWHRESAAFLATHLLARDAVEENQPCTSGPAEA